MVKMSSSGILFILLRINLALAAGGLMYPGTKWCGPGNSASSFDDLGTAVEEDSCCRSHDNCFDFLLTGQESSARGLKNTAAFTKLNCQCDKEFRDCLRRVNTKLSNTIGSIYFAVQSTCYKFEHPIVGCENENGFEAFILRKKEFIHRFLRKLVHANYNSPVSLCLNYRVDVSRPKKWQWLNLPQYQDTNSRPVFAT